MSTAASGMRGHPPIVTITPPENIVVKPTTGKVFDDKTKFIEPSQDQMRAIVEANTPNELEEVYEKVWKVDGYRNRSPGEELVPYFLEWAGEIPAGSSIVDWGCGTGRSSKALYDAGFDVTAVDFVDGCLNPEILELATDNPRFRFIKHDITKKSDFQADYGFCADMMEHLKPEDVPIALSNILLSCKKVYFQISTIGDNWGYHKDVDFGDLHLTVENYFWWLQKFQEQAVVIKRSEEYKHNVVFYVTGWSQPFFRQTDTKLNVDEEVRCANIAANAKLDFPHIMPHQPQDIEIMLLCGGVSALDCKDDIIQKREAGMPLVTVNGSFNMAIDWGLRPSLQCVLDARKFNKRFVSQMPGYTDTTKFIIATQCDPSLFVGLPEDRTYLWTVSGSMETLNIVKENYGEVYKDWWPCDGGSTVALRALVLLRMLGFSKIHIYGMDSCNFDDHHAYDQEENDGNRSYPVIVGKGRDTEKEFNCEAWHLFQANDFMAMVPRYFMDCDLAVYGNGLINALIEDASEIYIEEKVQEEIDRDNIT